MRGAGYRFEIPKVRETRASVVVHELN